MVPAEPAGVLLGWVTEIPLPGSEKQPGRPVRPRAGGPRRFLRSRGPSVVRPDDGPWFSDPRPGGAAWKYLQTLRNLAACHPRRLRAMRPRIIEALTRARGWRRLIDTSAVKNAAALARRHGVTRARVSQLLSLLRLAPEILEYIDGLEGTEGGLHLTARRLRDIEPPRRH